MKRIVLLSVAMLVCTFSITAFAAEPFDGFSLKGWKAVDPNVKNAWIVGRAEIDPQNERGILAKPLFKKDKKFDAGDLVNFVESNWTEEPRGGVDLYSEQKFGDATFEIEFMVSKGSNSGIYIMGEYEVQVCDSWGNANPGMGDIGALYGAAPPKVNASLEPGKWQKIVIEFIAPKFDGDKKVSNAKFVKITLNGKVVQENVEMKEQTPGGVTGKEAAKGPLMFQGNHGPVAYRNIKVIEK